MWGYVAELPQLSTTSLKEVAANDAALAARRAADAADAGAPPPTPPPPVPPSRPAGRKGSTSRGTMPSRSWLPPPHSSILENGMRENARAVSGPAVAGAAQPDEMAAGLAAAAAATTAATAAAATATATTGNAASLNLGDGLVVGGYGCFLIDHLHRGIDVRLGTSTPDPYHPGPHPVPLPTDY